MIAPGIQTQCRREIALQGDAPDGQAGKRTQMEDWQWFEYCRRIARSRTRLQLSITLQSMTKA
jgi:hypothetical protein